MPLSLSRSAIAIARCGCRARTYRSVIGLADGAGADSLFSRRMYSRYAVKLPVFGLKSDIACLDYKGCRADLFPFRSVF